MIGKWIRAVMDKRMPNKNIYMSKEDLIMKKNFNSFRIKRGLLYRQVKEGQEGTIDQLVLPKCYRESVLVGLHNDIGHPGRERTLSLLRERYFWAGMTVDVEQWINRCDRCLRRKSSTNISAELINIETSYPVELVCLDYLTLEQSKGGIGNILVITDHFTKYAMAIPTRNETAKTTADAFYNNFILYYGIPTKLHSDQGANFESDIIKELCNIMGMTKTRTSVYHAMGNGCTERYNRTLLNMLGTLEQSKKADWKRYVPSLVYAYNCTRHESTKVSPFKLMFGRRPKLPIDSVFETAMDSSSNRTTVEYLEDLKNRLKTTQELVKQHSDKPRLKQKYQFDKKANAAKITVGDKVLVKLLAFEGKHKIADRFEEDLYEVISQPRRDIPVFKVRSEKGIEKTLHRNHLLPVDSTGTGRETNGDHNVVQSSCGHGTKAVIQNHKSINE